MDTFKTPWYKWCYLCAKKDSNENIEISTKKDAHVILIEALEKHFGIRPSVEDLLPKSVCQDCYSFISSIVHFSKHVEQVQHMYKFLVENSADESCNLQAMRMKFGICKGNTTQWGLCKRRTRRSSSVVEKTEYITNNELDIESDYSKYAENYKNICKEERLYDEVVYVGNNNPNDDGFDTSEDSVWGDDDDKVNVKSFDKETSWQNLESNIVKTTNFSDQSCANSKKTKTFYRRMKPPVEDFVIDLACTECKQKFNLYSAYCEHMNVMHGSLEKLCPLCRRNLKTWYHLGRHMRGHMPVESRYPFKCPKCDGRYTTRASLEVHLNHKHRNEKPYICEVCGFSGATKRSITAHMYSHKDETPHECEVCKKRFKKRTQLNFHMDVHGPNKFVCTICGLQLNTRATLRNHFLVHSDKRRHKCDVCGSAFKRSRSLKEHLFVHTGIKPYPCNFCDLSFGNRYPCRQHMLKMHPEELAAMEAGGQKAYTKNVPTLATLKETIKTADNLKPMHVNRLKKKNFFECTFCDKKFCYRGSCRYHMKQKHPREYASLPESEKLYVNYSLSLRTRKSTAAKAKPPGDPVACQFCGRTFGYRQLCLGHIRRMHADR